MDQIELNNTIYISAKRAAKLTGYATDYVGQLCRNDKVAAVRIGRSWYINERSIQLHKAGLPQESASPQPDSTAVTEESVEETKGAYNTRTLQADNRVIARYESDDTPILPTLYRYSKQLDIKGSLGKTPVDDVTQHIFGNNKSQTKVSFNIFSLLRYGRMAATAAIFVLIAGLFFTVNASFIATSVYENINAAVQTAEAVHVGEVSVGEVLEPFSLSAAAFASLIDDTVYSYFYGDFFPQ